MAVPKHKISKSKRDSRRAHYKASAPSVSRCPQCGEPTLPHHACPECGTYKGRAIVEKED